MIICLSTDCSKKDKCGTFGKKNTVPYQNYATYKEKFCKQFKPK